MTIKPPTIEEIDKILASDEWKKRQEDKIQEEQNYTKKKQDLYKSDRFYEIINYIKDNDAVIDGEDLLYFPDKHPVSEEEFVMFCEVIMDDPNNETHDVTETFRQYETIFDGVSINLAHGQGSVFFAKKAEEKQKKTSKPPMPQPPRILRRF